jgi:hypothetical protein
VLAAGPSGLLRLPAGSDERFAARPLPAGLDDITAIAVEPHATARLAVGHQRCVAVLDGVGTVTIRIPDEKPTVTHLAWGPHPSGAFLYIVDDDFIARRTDVRTHDVEELPLDFVIAMATDEKGALALASAHPDGKAVWLTRDGENWHWRQLDALDFDLACDLAVAGDAVAAHMAWGGVWVSRGREEPFVRCEALGTGGPVTFEGTDEGSPLLCAIEEDAGDAVLRVDVSGAVTRVATVDRPEGQDERCIRELAWDASRRTLWAVVEGAGLLRLTPGDEQHGAQRLLS